MSNSKLTDKGNMIEAYQPPVPLAPGQVAAFHGLPGSSYKLYFKNIDPNLIGILEGEEIRGGNIIFDKTLLPYQPGIYNGIFSATGALYVLNSTLTQMAGRPVITVSIVR